MCACHDLLTARTFTEPMMMSPILACVMATLNEEKTSGFWDENNAVHLCFHIVNVLTYVKHILTMRKTYLDRIAFIRPAQNIQLFMLTGTSCLQQFCPACS
jgi:hypothetical protein